MFALYERYGVKKNNGLSLDLSATEQAIRNAYTAAPDVLRPIINDELILHEPMIDRDHSCRTYSSLLRRVIGADSDLDRDHVEKMNVALAALSQPKS